MRALQPDWVLPGGELHGVVNAVSTTRYGGVSQTPFNAMNLGDHVGDSTDAVAINRAHLKAYAGGRQLNWLTQVHGTAVVDACDWQAGEQADGSIVRDTATAAVVMTADCLPVLLATRDGRVVAAIHAGWRGLVAGIISEAVMRMRVPPHTLMAWLGPVISQAAFEVGDEVADAFIQADTHNAAYFEKNAAHRWQADLPGIATGQLRGLGVVDITGGDACTYSDPERFFSYRRQSPCGRMATAIWRL